MALSSKLISFMLLISLFSSQIHARESHFFSKVSRDNKVQETNNTIKDAQEPTKADSLNKQIPEPKPKQSENENSYGLYGQETSQSTNYAPYITTADGGRIYDLSKDPLLKNKENIADTKFQEKDESYIPRDNQNSNYYYKGEYGYNPDQQEERFAGSSYTKAYDENYYNGHNKHSNQQLEQGFEDTRFADNDYNNMANKNYQYNGGKMYDNVQKQGLSDTRFLENGRYFYDVNKDRYNPNQYGIYGEMSSRNEYYNKNYMGGYNQEEFQENYDRFMP